MWFQSTCVILLLICGVWYFCQLTRPQQDYQSLNPHFVSPADVFICGGYNGELILADLWKINLQTFQWSKLPAVMPEPAYFHCAAVTPVSRAQT